MLVSALALVFIALYRDRTAPEGVDLFKRVWGVGVLAVLLGVAADFAPTVAGPFALLVVLGAMTQGGDRAFVNALGNLGGSSSPSRPTAGAASSAAGSRLRPFP